MLYSYWFAQCLCNFFAGSSHHLFFLFFPCFLLQHDQGAVMTMYHYEAWVTTNISLNRKTDAMKALELSKAKARKRVGVLFRCGDRLWKYH